MRNVSFILQKKTYGLFGQTNTITKVCKQPKHPLLEEWMKKLQYIYTMEYYTAINKGQLPFVMAWIDL